MPQEEVMSYPSVKQSWGIAGMGILMMILFSPVTILLDKVAGKGISFLVYYLFAMGTTLWIAHQKRKNRTGESGFDFEFSSVKITLLVSMAIVAIQIGIVSPIVNLIPMPEFMKKVFLEFAKQKGIFSFITVVVAAPILEELLFRGIMLNGLLKRYSPLKAILVSSLLFGVVHLNPWQFIAALLIGVFSGWVYYKTKKLTLSILIHFVNNLLAFGSMQMRDAETMINQTLTELYGGFTNMIMIVSGAILVAAICLYLLRLEFENKQFSYGRPQPLM